MLPHRVRLDLAVIPFLDLPSIRVWPALLAVCLVTTAACSHLRQTEGPNAVGAHLAYASYTASEPRVGGVEVSNADGDRLSFSRRLKGGRGFWLGPEAFFARTDESKLSASRSDYPAGVSRSFAAALVRVNYYPFDKEEGDFWRNVFSRIGLGVGAGVAYGRFSESERLINGTLNTRPQTDGVFGPTLGLGFDYRVSKHIVLRADGYSLFLKPRLSFPWPAEDNNISGFGVLFTW